MRGLCPIAMLLVAVLPARAADFPKPVLPQRVLYVGKPGSDRAREFETFLKRRFANAAVADRDALNSAATATADVVILDWSQSDAQGNGRLEFPYPERTLKSPLGPRDAWGKPTVLIGSAGHLLAACWEIHGGSG
jgi:hypothetical protein